MDEIFTKEKLQIAIPVLFGAIYFSAFKNGKQTCDRYFLNYFLYLLMSLALYYYTMNEVNIDLKGLSIIVFIGVIGCLFAFHMVENIYLKHLLWISILKATISMIGLMRRNMLINIMVMSIMKPQDLIMIGINTVHLL